MADPMYIKTSDKKCVGPLFNEMYKLNIITRYYTNDFLKTTYPCILSMYIYNSHFSPQELWTTTTTTTTTKVCLCTNIGQITITHERYKTSVMQWYIASAIYNTTNVKDNATVHCKANTWHQRWCIIRKNKESAPS